jgi:hypothetical protein
VGARRLLRQTVRAPQETLVMVNLRLGRFRVEPNCLGMA